MITKRTTTRIIAAKTHPTTFQVMAEE